jgi:DNA-binding CsgD family transcriptional regulator/tetratricopeptide (TPR) repeat protein
VAGVVADIERGRGALERRAWSEAYEVLSPVAPSALAGADLEGLADAAWWTLRLDESIAFRQKAYAAYAAAGDKFRAGGTAARLAIEHFTREEPAVGAGWLGRAQRHLDGVGECAELGLLTLIEATVARFGGDLDGAIVMSGRATEIARHVGEPNVLALAIHTEGLTLIAAGRIGEGMPLLDEAMTAAIAGELTDYYAGVVYCNVIEACLNVADVRRADEWSAAATAWSDSLKEGSIYPGLCRVNRAEVASMRGEWTRAEAEALRAVDEVTRFDPSVAASALYQVGEIRRRRGDAAGAEKAFADANGLGFEPQPGLALLRLAQGKLDTAHRALRRDTAATTPPLRRAQQLSARVEVAIVVGDVDDARRASEELETLSERIDTPALAAEAATARGMVEHAEGRIDEAVLTLRDAFSRWHKLRIPYEAARARGEYGRALLVAGDEDDAILALRAAASALDALGAVPDARRVASWLPSVAELPLGLTAREAEVLRLVAAGRTNREIGAELFISEHTVARHLQNMFVKLGVSTRSAATAAAFEHGLN